MAVFVAAVTEGQRAVTVVLALGLLGGALATALTLGEVVRRLGRLADDTARLRAGEDLGPLDFAGDELGRLARDFSDTAVELRARERDLSEAQSFLRGVVDAGPVTILRWRAGDGVVDYASANSERITGFRPDELLGRSRPLAPILGPPAAAGADMEALLAGEADQVEAVSRFRRPDGTSRWLHAVTRLAPNGHGEPHLLTYLRNVTERHEAEEERDRFLDLSLDLLCIADIHGHFLRLNPAWSSTLGYTLDELRDRPFLDFVHPDDMESTQEAVGHLEEGELVTSFVNRYRHKDGGYRWLQWTSSPVPETGRIYAIARDVTDTLSRQEELRLAKDEAEAANRAKSEFLSRVSHELRTPMNSVLGFAQLLDMDDLTDPQRESIRQILGGGRHLLDLIDDVLDIASVESGRLPMSVEPVLVEETVRECLALVRPLAERTGVAVRFEEGDHADTTALADRQRIRQVFLNILSNGIKYNTPDGTLTIREERAGDCIRVAFVDTGRGLDDAQLAHLFTPFDRLGAQAAGGVEGTGLGLALSKGLLEAMGGTIEVSSTPGKGTVFTVALPLATEEHLTREDDDAEADIADVAAPGGPKGRVLYIEDNLANVHLVERILGRYPGLELVTAMQGSMGVDLATAHRPDVVLLDVHLPDISGEEVVARLRERPDTTDIPVIVLSADATAAQKRRMLQAGARAYLTKPVDVREFLTLLRTTLAPGNGGGSDAHKPSSSPADPTPIPRT